MQTLYYAKCMLWDLHIYKSIFSQSPNFWGRKKNKRGKKIEKLQFWRYVSATKKL